MYNDILEVLQILLEERIYILKFERLSNIHQPKKWQEAQQISYSLWRIKRMLKSEKMGSFLWLFSEKVSER